jgi:hypothetical protein
MVGNGGVAARICVVPDFMTSGCLPVELEATSLQAADNLSR